MVPTDSRKAAVSTTRRLTPTSPSGPLASRSTHVPRTQTQRRQDRHRNTDASNATSPPSSTVPCSETSTIPPPTLRWGAALVRPLDSAGSLRGIRLIGAVLNDAHDEWQISDRRYLSESSMAKLYPASNTGASPQSKPATDIENHRKPTTGRDSILPTGPPHVRGGAPGSIVRTPTQRPSRTTAEKADASWNTSSNACPLCPQVVRFGRSLASTTSLTSDGDEQRQSRAKSLAIRASQGRQMAHEPKGGAQRRKMEPCVPSWARPTLRTVLHHF
jgi:hypothetical protein